MSFNLTPNPSPLEEKGIGTPEIKVVEKIVEKESQVENILKKIDVNNMTPMEALNKLSELKG
ncbi:MAG: hypothetical protein ACPHY8_04865, partial [Patescibacteria group bacterium]